MEEDKTNLEKILLLLFFVTTVVIGAAYLFSIKSNIKFSSIIPNINLSSGEKKKDLGYNFEIPEVSREEAQAEAGTQTTPTPSPTATPEPSVVANEGTKEEILTQEQKDFAFNYNVTEGQAGTILIPAIGVNSPVINGSDGDAILDKGFWHYPSSNMPGQGETIILCHRRFFGQQDPRTCWNLDFLKPGDFIQVNDNAGKPISYVVKSVNVKTPDDLNIYQLSKENYLKIISCSLENGRPGGSTHRVIVVAEKV